MFAPRLIAAGLIALILPAGFVVAGDLGKQPLDREPIKVLNDRIRLRAPAGAKIEPRGAESIMGAAPSMQEECRIVFSLGSEKLVVMVHETFSTATPDNLGPSVQAQVDQWNKAAGATDAGKDAVEAIKLPEGSGLLAAFATVPAKIAARDDTAVARGAFYLLPDKTVLFAAVCVNAEAAKDPAAVSALAKSVLASAQAGSRKLAAEKKTEQLYVYSEKNALAIDLPAGYVVAQQEGPDFLVYRVRPLAPFGDTVQGITIYYGGHPRPPAGDKEEKGRLLGQAVTWKTSSAKDGNRTPHRAETLVQKPVPGEQQMFLHVIVTATDEADLAKLRGVIETLKATAYVKAPTSAPAGAQ